MSVGMAKVLWGQNHPLVEDHHSRGSKQSALEGRPAFVYIIANSGYLYFTAFLPVSMGPNTIHGLRLLTVCHSTLTLSSSNTHFTICLLQNSLSPRKPNSSCSRSPSALQDLLCSNSQEFSLHLSVALKISILVTNSLSSPSSPLG